MRLLVAALTLLSALAAHGQSPFALRRSANRASSDVYLSGSYASAVGESTVYAFDLKLRYPRFYRRLNPGSLGGRRYFVFSPLGEFTTSRGTRASPDRIRLGADIVYLWDANPPEGRRPLVASRQWITQPAGEFDRRFATRSFVAASFYRLVFRSLNTLDARGAPKALKLGFTPTLDAGFEGGENFRNRLSRKTLAGGFTPGSGAIARIYGGVSVEQQLFTRQIVAQAAYQYRGPLRAEAFAYRPRPRAGEARPQPVDTLTAKPRHSVELGLGFPLASWFSLKPLYRWGSLPPSFNFLDHQFQISLELKGQVPIPN